MRGAGGWGEAGKGREIYKARDKVSTTASRTKRGRREEEHTPGVILVAARAWRGEGEQGRGGRVEAGPSDDDHATARGANSSCLPTVPVHLSTNRPSPAHLSISGISPSPWRRRPLPPSSRRNQNISYRPASVPTCIAPCASPSPASACARAVSVRRAWPPPSALRASLLRWHHATPVLGCD